MLKRPAAALALTVALFGALSLGLLAYEENYSATAAFKKSAESVDGFKALERQVPAGATDPTTVLVSGRDGGPPSPDAVAETQQRLERQPGIASVVGG